MVLPLDPKLEAVLREQAGLQGLTVEEFALNLLREKLLCETPPQPRDDWERGLLSAARPWGIAHSDAALSSDGLYD